MQELSNLTRSKIGMILDIGEKGGMGRQDGAGKGK